MNRMLLRSILPLVVLLAAAGSVAAGGWATVRLDAEPGRVVAGEEWSFGFMVKQHDRTPTNEVTPVVWAIHVGSGEVMTVEGVQTGAVGHFEATIMFPAAGVWKWEIAPEPYGATSLETLTVVPAGEGVQVAGPRYGAGGMLGRLMVAAMLETAGAGETTSGEAVEVVITDGGYRPSRLEIVVGTEVVWTNQSALAHDVGSDNLDFFDSGLLDPGEQFRQIFSEAGTYHYACGPHPFMIGTIVVSE